MQQYGLMMMITIIRYIHIYIYRERERESRHCKLCGVRPITNALGYVSAVMRRCKHLMEMKKYIYSCVLTTLYTIFYQEEQSDSIKTVYFYRRL